MDERMNFLLAQGEAMIFGSLRKQKKGHSNLNWVFCNWSASWLAILGEI